MVHRRLTHVPAFNATLTIVALVLCNHVSSGESSAPYEAAGMSDRALKDSLSQALACLPLIDKGNKMVDKCADFVATLNHCLQLLGEGPELVCQPIRTSYGDFQLLMQALGCRSVEQPLSSRRNPRRWSKCVRNGDAKGSRAVRCASYLCSHSHRY